MNSIKCPQCGLINATSAPFCVRCGRSFESLPAHAYVSVSAEEQAKSASQQTWSPGQQIPFPAQPVFHPDVALQDKVWTWYIVFCGVMSALYILCALAGVGLLVFAPVAPSRERFEATIHGVALVIVGPLFLIPFAAAPFLGKKPWTWYYGLGLLAFASTGGCCLWPITIPLIIQWLKPDIKAMFGKK